MDTYDLGSNTFWLPSGQEEVPRDQSGVYLFRLRFPSDGELGFATGVTTEVVKQNILKVSIRFHQALVVRELAGSIVTPKYAGWLRQGYELQAHTLLGLDEKQRWLEDSVKSVEDNAELRRIAAILRGLFNNSTPIYVGMCQEQSFRGRLDQHLAGKTAMAQYLSDNELAWRDLAFVTMPVVRGSVGQATKLERALQALLTPPASKK